jgi:site-specific DNA-methyltransferase (adenine-specific)
MLKLLKTESVDIVFLDPPFNLGKRYGTLTAAHDRQTEESYATYHRGILEETARVLAVGGSLFIYHIPLRAMQFATFVGNDLTFRHWIAISMKNGFVRGDRLYPAHYALLHYSKGAPKRFRRPKIAPLTCRSCGEYVRDYGGYRRFIENGVNLSDVWDDVSPVRHTKYKNRTANELPMIIPSRALAMVGVQGGVFVDPFAGTGTTLVAARLAKMYFIGCDREPDNVEIMRSRLVPARRIPNARP